MGWVRCWTENGIWDISASRSRWWMNIAISFCYKYAHIHSSIHLQDDFNAGNTRQREHQTFHGKIPFKNMNALGVFTVFEANRREKKFVLKVIRWMGRSWANNEKLTTERFHKNETQLAELNRCTLNISESTDFQYHTVKCIWYSVFGCFASCTNLQLYEINGWYAELHGAPLNQRHIAHICIQHTYNMNLYLCVHGINVTGWK